MKELRKAFAGRDLLSAEEVAEYLGVGKVTIYRWCREGTLPCLKIGRTWRVRREVLEDFLKRSEHPTTLVGQLSSFLRVPDNVLAIAQDTNVLRRLDAAFFQVGEARGGLLVKFYGGEKDPEAELRAHLERNGLEVGRLEQEGRFFMRPERDPLGGREDELGRFIEEAGEERTVWASFDWVMQVDLDRALEQQERLAEIVDARQLVVKTAALSEVIDEWSSTELRQAQSLHSTTILASESGLSLSRATPMPPS
ncbi:MAG: helix-turn-helix domain-containing protein [Actinomycetota bacterium]|nr:helix-turn-helix domain-containing protein [Actinomycetota bacterium]